MNNSARRTTAVVGTIAAATTDDTPASGQEFRLSGAVWSAGDRVPATIRVKTWRDGEWVQLPGAVVQTN